MNDAWLRGWKAIAKYIGRSERTARTYHYELGMPLHNSPGGPVGIKSELNRWLLEYSNRKDKTKSYKGFMIKTTNP